MAAILLCSSSEGLGMFGASHRAVGTPLNQGLLNFDAPILDIAPEQIQGNSALISTKLAVGIAHTGNMQFHTMVVIEVYSNIVFSTHEKVNGFERNTTDRIQSVDRPFVCCP